MSLNNFVAFRYASEFYQFCETLKLPTHLRDQLRRSSSSVALNLAESSGKSTPADRRRFYAIANGSFQESKAILMLTNVSLGAKAKLVDELGAILYRLVYPK